jgi:5-methyltetrahydrofolate--homocysteine methyltransferase
VVEVRAQRASKPIATLHQLRQQGQHREGVPNKSLADFIAPVDSGLADHIGAFAVTAGIGLPEKVQEFKDDLNDYDAILLEALADRLAEAFAERLHERVRTEFWGYVEESFDNDDLIAEKYSGIRPAAGYPACPDHTEKQTIWELLDVKANTGIELTESMAMWPGASVSGLYYSHPASQYFVVGRLGRDQIADYAERKGWTIAEAEKWLSPNLGYDPDD